MVDEFREAHSEHSGIYLRVERVLYRGRSKYQDILVFENGFFGKVLVLDGLVMTTERDEFIYHETLVHPAMQFHPNPKNVLVVGGGDGGTLREVLKYDIQSVHLVEIDEQVIDVSKRFFSQMARSFEDERVKVIIEDASKFVKQTENTYDIIIVDSTDPVGPAKSLIHEDFYSNLKRILNENGIASFQTESPIYHMHLVKDIYRKLRNVFRYVYPFTAPVPTYPGGYWSFMLASDSCLRNVSINLPKDLKYLNEEVLKTLFNIPQFMKQALR